EMLGSIVKRRISTPLDLVYVICREASRARLTRAGPHEKRDSGECRLRGDAISAKDLLARDQQARVGVGTVLGKIFSRMAIRPDRESRCKRADTVIFHMQILLSCINGTARIE